MFGRELLEINEVFGPTVQGEGAAAGRHCLFLRVANCNLECAWCDTAYTWAFSKTKAEKTISGKVYDKSENVKQMTDLQVIDALLGLWDIENKPTIIVVSGGEPMMQQYKLIPLLRRLRMMGNEVHIETAGTIKPHADFDQYVNQYNVSPKLHHSNNRQSKRFKPEALEFFANSNKAWFKFVVMPHAGMDGQDFWEVDEMVGEFRIDPRHVMIMPEGKTVEGTLDCARTWSTMALNRGYGISFRTHILLWPEIERGR
jgi:organic radical activating enzyme